jgi:hypothetical protein
LGSYTLLKNISDSDDDKVGFIPSIEFLTPYVVYEPRLPTNMEPTKIESLVKLGLLDPLKIHKANYTTIARAAQMSEA